MKKMLTAKRVLFRAFSTFIGLLVGLLLAEVVCRFHAFGWGAFCFAKTSSLVAIGYSGYVQPAENQHVWYELKPNMNGLFKMRTIRTNSRGLRDHEYPLAKPPGVYRVAVIGDSFTFGDGVEAEETYHAILEEKLNGLSDSLRFEFINFGLGGYDLLNYLGNMEAKAVAYQPDLFLIGFCGNNDDDLPEAKQYTGSFGLRYEKWTWAVRHFQLVRMVANQVSVQRRLGNEEASDEKSLRKKAFVREMFGEFGRVQAECGTPIMVAYLSMADAAPAKAEMVAGLCREQGFRFVDTSPVVAGFEDISEYWFHPTDRHPNERMHGVYADVLLKEFVEVVAP